MNGIFSSNHSCQVVLQDSKGDEPDKSSPNVESVNNHASPSIVVEKQDHSQDIFSCFRQLVRYAILGFTRSTRSGCPRINPIRRQGRRLQSTPNTHSDFRLVACDVLYFCRKKQSHCGYQAQAKVRSSSFLRVDLRVQTLLSCCC